MSQEAPSLHQIRHSLAHIMAQAVMEMRPGTKLGFGPAIDDGFYYDFILSEPLSEDDFSDIEKRMKKIIKQGQVFEREDLDRGPALDRIAEMGEPYKREYAEELLTKQELNSLSFYRNGPFLDMCEGPHVENTKQIPPNCFKLRSMAGAYWRGDEKNVMMTRIYAWAFEDKEQLKAHIDAWRLAQARDHKKLGKELEIFHIDELIGRGLPLWHPNGTVIRDEVENYLKELEFKAGYQRVSTPQLARTELYYKTGHMPYYQADMYPIMEIKEKSEDGSTDDVKDSYCLRPMNCPHHHMIYAAKKRSYRELPLRLAEFGQVYRFEDSGSLSGMLRVRGFCQNDAHIYCTEDQAEDEFLKVMQMHDEVYRRFGLTNFYMRFSTWDPEDPKGKEKYFDNPEQWEKTQNIIQRAMDKSGIQYVEGKGEAAFYGPKIDFQIKTVTGREETASTNQLDFGIPYRLDLKYVGADNTDHHPYIIHRAPAGSHERFAAFLIEHFGGAFPVWLAPIQVRLIAVADKYNNYAQKCVDRLREQMIRAEVDDSADSMGKKIRKGAKAKIPCLLIVGEREEQEEKVTLRQYGIEEQNTVPFAQFEDWMRKHIRERTLKVEWNASS